MSSIANEQFEVCVYTLPGIWERAVECRSGALLHEEEESIIEAPSRRYTFGGRLRKYVVSFRLFLIEHGDEGRSFSFLCL